MKNSRQILSAILIISVSLTFCAFGKALAYGKNCEVSVSQIDCEVVEDGQVGITLSFDNPDYDGSGTIICMLYNSSGICEEIAVESVLDFSQSGYVLVSGRYDIIRVFIWDSLDTIKPLGKVSGFFYSGDKIVDKEIPAEVFDEKKQNEVAKKLTRLLEELDYIATLPWVEFTPSENEILVIIKDVIGKTMSDAKDGKWIYVEDYVLKTYNSEVMTTRSMYEALEEAGEAEAFKDKLGELPLYLNEYLADLFLGKDINDETEENPDDGEFGEIPGDEGGEDGPVEEEVFDEQKQNESVGRLTSLLEELDYIATLPWVKFTPNENEILVIIKDVVGKTISDAKDGKWIYVEDYVFKTYNSEVMTTRSMYEALEEAGEAEAFKDKLGELPLYLIEYLADTMFGIDIKPLNNI